MQGDDAIRSLKGAATLRDSAKILHLKAPAFIDESERPPDTPPAFAPTSRPIGFRLENSPTRCPCLRVPAKIPSPSPQAHSCPLRIALGSNNQPAFYRSCPAYLSSPIRTPDAPRPPESPDPSGIHSVFRGICTDPAHPALHAINLGRPNVFTVFRQAIVYQKPSHNHRSPKLIQFPSGMQPAFSKWSPLDFLLFFWVGNRPPHTYLD